MNKRINFELEIEEGIYKLLKEFIKRAQNVNTIKELVAAYIRQGIAGSIQQIVAEKITIDIPNNKPVPVVEKEGAS